MLCVHSGGPARVLSCGNVVIFNLRVLHEITGTHTAARCSQHRSQKNLQVAATADRANGPHLLHACHVASLSP